jgi:hypothetical protein
MLESLMVKNGDGVPLNSAETSTKVGGVYFTHFHLKLRISITGLYCGEFSYHGLLGLD